MFTCMSCGDEAQFWIDHGVGKEITREEALARLDKSRDEGLIPGCYNTRKVETICSCHCDCCVVFGGLKKLGLNTRAAQNLSHSTLEVAQDTCAKCGACAERCPMDNIVMDEKTGYPVLGDVCVACGQCAYVCPTKSRWLVAKPKGTFLEHFEDLVEVNNMLAADRFESGLIY